MIKRFRAEYMKKYYQSAAYKESQRKCELRCKQKRANACAAIFDDYLKKCRVEE